MTTIVVFCKSMISRFPASGVVSLALHSTAQYSSATQHPSIMQCCTVLHSSPQYYTVLHSTTAFHSTPVLHSAMQYYTVLHSTPVPHRTTQYYTALHSTTQHYTALFSTPQHYTLLHSITQYYIDSPPVNIHAATPSNVCHTPPQSPCLLPGLNTAPVLPPPPSCLWNHYPPPPLASLHENLTPRSPRGEEHPPYPGAASAEWFLDPPMLPHSL